MRNWVLGSVTTVMAVGGLFVASHAVQGVAYYGGLLYFLFAVFFVFFLIKVSYDEFGETSALSEFREWFAGVTAVIKPETASARPGHIVVNKIDTADLKDVLVKGIDDFRQHPTHLIILCFIYPFLGLFLARLTAGYDVLTILFPLVSGFALIGPLAATGLYELSRRHEQGLKVSWWHVFHIVHSHSIYALMTLGIVMALIFFAWLAAAQAIYELYFGSWVPPTFADFVSQILTTPAGWKLVAVGCGVGFLFAIFVLLISVVSLPMLLDRDVGAAMAVKTSVRAVLANPKPLAVWGLIVAGSLMIGSLPFFIGLAIVVPILGHATWHLYRKLVGY